MESNAARPGWCHSDTGSVLPLLASSQRLDEGNYLAEALSMGESLVSRAGEDLSFEDAGFCHGAAGFTHVLHLLHRATGCAAAGDAARVWLARIIAMRRPGQGLAGFPAWRPDKGGWATVESIFEGDLGVALVLLAAIGEPAPPWEHLFALDAYSAVPLRLVGGGAA